MPPKRLGRSNKGFISSTYESLTSPENASVVRSVALFGVCPALDLERLLLTSNSY